MSVLDAPADIAQLHPRIDGWTRGTPWRRSVLRRDHYQATYSPAVALLKQVRVFVHRNVIKNPAAAWDIARQITAGRRSVRAPYRTAVQQEGDRL